MLVVDNLGSVLHGFASKRRDNKSLVSSLNAEYLAQDFVKSFLRSTALVTEVPCSPSLDGGSSKPKGSCDIVHVDGIYLQVPIPEKLHLLCQVLVDGSDDKARSWLQACQ